ncbi:MAG: hypothetical protein C0167_02795, partial [Nitrososphaera sp.]
LLTTKRIEPVKVEKGKEGDEEDLVQMVERLQKQALRVKLQMDVLRSMGLLRDEEDKGRDALKELMEHMKGKDGEKMSVQDMMTYAIMMKALGGEKSTDWKEFMTILMQMQEKGKGKEVDPLELLKHITEAQRAAREEEAERWKPLVEMLSKSEGGGDLEAEIGRTAVEALRKKIISTLEESLNPPKKITDEKGRINWEAVANRVLDTVSDVIKKLPEQRPPPPQSEGFEVPAAAEVKEGEVVEGGGEEQQPAPAPAPEQEQGGEVAGEEAAPEAEEQQPEIEPESEE